MIRAKKIYRKEDIIAMGEKPVNAGWGPRGASTYNIWFYKGGGNCHHFWMRKTYMAKGHWPNVKKPNTEITVIKARRDGLKPIVNDIKVAKRPFDMEDEGFLPK